MQKTILTALLLLLISASHAQLKGKGVIYLVRHAEKESGADPALTKAGQQRAGDLMRALKDAKLRRIYVSQFKRTQQTADSLRIQYHIDTIQALADTAGLALFEAISRRHDWNNRILIISHSNIIPALIRKLGVDFPQQYLPENEFDQIYILQRHKGKIWLTQQRYGQPNAASASMKGLHP